LAIFHTVFQFLLIRFIRLFIKEGPLVKICRSKHTQRWVFLFNDMLIYASEFVGNSVSSHKRFQFHKHFMLSTLRVDDLPDRGAFSFNNEVIPNLSICNSIRMIISFDLKMLQFHQYWFSLVYDELLYSYVCLLTQLSCRNGTEDYPQRVQDRNAKQIVRSLRTIGRGQDRVAANHQRGDHRVVGQAIDAESAGFGRSGGDGRGAGVDSG
jgi:hypothetical protein